MNSIRLGMLALCIGLMGCGSETESPHLSGKPATKPDQANPPPAQTAQNSPSPTPSSNAPSNSSNGGSMVTAPVDYLASSIRAGNQAKGTMELATIRKAIEAYQQEMGKNPQSLDELVEKKFMNPLAPPPPNQQYQYDPATGTVTLVPK